MFVWFVACLFCGVAGSLWLVGLGWLLDLLRCLLVVGDCLMFVSVVNSVVVGNSLFLLLFCWLLIGVR